MAFTCGFYNGPNRMYNAEQLSSIFDGIISDGMYSNYRKSMIVIKSENNNEVIVQPGRAWLMHTWSLVDANLPVEAPQSEVVLDRIDALVIDVNTNPEVKNNEITWVQGTPASKDPKRPVLVNEQFHKQYPLCYVYRAAGTTSITQANITNTVGTSELPFVTGIIDTINTDELLLQWEAKWEEFMANYVSDFSAWSTAQKAAFETWFESIRGILDEDAAGHLQNEIDALRNDVDTLQNEVDGVEELILPIGDSEAAPADTWTAMQVKNGDNVARLQMNAEGALRLFQSTDNGGTWSQKEVGEKPTVRYNSETKYYEVQRNGIWYQDRYFDPTWNGIVMDGGNYDSHWYSTSYAQSAQNVTNYSQVTASNSYGSSGQVFRIGCVYNAVTLGWDEFVMQKAINVGRPCVMRIWYSWSLPAGDTTYRVPQLALKTTNAANGRDVFSGDPSTTKAPTGAIDSKKLTTNNSYINLTIAKANINKDLYLSVALGLWGSDSSKSNTLTIKKIQIIYS